jgi:hypothetical protein
MTAALNAILKLAEQLDPLEQETLMQRLRAARMQRTIPAQPEQLTQQLQSMRLNVNPTRDELLAELEIVQHLPVNPENRLLGKYADPTQPALSNAELKADIHAIVTEWERELDEFYPDQS